ncbi:MAG TPA: GntR family transcriptional regulator [Polyangiaceae bacterium]|nr:GntR family transcriptional regulator [Polyangiaceae bacterium]
MVEATFATPLYAQIARRLRAQIQSGTYPAGCKIPSEHELAAHFHVGRPTVRQATQLLVDERVLERRRGSGTYVSGAPREVDLFSAGGTLASFTRSGFALETRVVAPARLVTTPSEIERLAGRAAFFVERTSLVDGEPVLLERMYFDAELFRGLDRMNLEGRSLSEIARAEYMLEPIAAEQRFHVTSLDEAGAQRLALPIGTHVLKVQRIIDFRTASAAVVAELYCNTLRLQFTQRLAFGRGGSVDLTSLAGPLAARSA